MKNKNGSTLCYLSRLPSPDPFSVRLPIPFQKFLRLARCRDDGPKRPLPTSVDPDPEPPQDVGPKRPPLHFSMLASSSDPCSSSSQLLADLGSGGGSVGNRFASAPSPMVDSVLVTSIPAPLRARDSSSWGLTRAALGSCSGERSAPPRRTSGRRQLPLHGAARHRRPQRLSGRRRVPFRGA